jgi:hypothetical protein
MPTHREPAPRAFDPDRIAYFEAAGWRAYYDRKWLRLLRLLISLCQEQFRIPFPRSLVAAYYIVRASMAWVPVDHDTANVRRFYERFYRLARRTSGLAFDPASVAALELRYNEDHRRLVGNPDKGPLLETMIHLHSALFGLGPERVRESAEFRVQAMRTVDTITGRTSTDIEGDWARIEDDLRRCYRSLQRELARQRSAQSSGLAREG